jgi:hypothetical protein
MIGLMMNGTTENFRQLVIEDPYCLAGDGVFKFLVPIVEALAIKFVLIRDASGASASAELSHGGWMTAEEFKSHVGTPTQFDWAFFFMFSENLSTNLTSLELANDRSLIEEATITARLADSHQIFIYGRESVAYLDKIAMAQNLVENKICRLMDLEIPY